MFTRLRFLSVLPGLALTFIQENSFKPESGSRPGIPKIGVFITDGKSQDDVIPPAQRLRDAGIEVFAIGTLTGFIGGEGEQRRTTPRVWVLFIQKGTQFTQFNVSDV